ncbi:MAG: type II secretion system F family protein [Cellulosilyticaceae bacterium]
MKARRVSPIELSLFCKQLAIILKSGMMLEEGIGLVKEGIEDARLGVKVELLEKELMAFKPLDEALGTVEIFPKHIVAMLQIGFESGKLEEVLEGLAGYYESEYILKERLRQAVVQPLILLGLFLGVFGIIVIKVLPIFNQIFLGLGSEMSQFATRLLEVGMLLGDNLIWLMLGLVVIGMGIYVLFRLEKITLQEPRKIAMAQFASAMTLMLSSGVSFDESFEQSIGVVNNKKIVTLLKSCIEDAQDKHSLIETMCSKEVMGKWQMRLLIIAYKAGSIDEAMARVAKMYEEEYIKWTDKWISRIEPSFVILFSGLIGGVLISVMFPLMSIMSSIG